MPSSSHSVQEGRGEDGVDDHALAILADQPQLFSSAWFPVQVTHDAVVVVVRIGKLEVGPRPLYNIAANFLKLAFYTCMVAKYQYSPSNTRLSAICGKYSYSKPGENW